MNLIDADALSKLAHWDLLEELALLTGTPIAETATLSSLVHRAARSCAKPDGKLFRDAVAASRAHAYLSQFAPLPSPAEDVLALMQHVPAIDPGEALLFAALHARPDTLLITGDKRAITALARAAPLPLLTSFANRILTIEQIVLALLEVKGIDWLREHVCPSRSLDKAIGIVMGSECRAPAESVEAGLRSYIANLRSTTGRLLCATAPFK
ncbi:MAG TPA: hypothetical protein VG897_19475 [Terriglobales bacterium]|nr:hypothetical protein [Terriglobales bacterium]